MQRITSKNVFITTEKDHLAVAPNLISPVDAQATLIPWFPPEILPHNHVIHTFVGDAWLYVTIVYAFVYAFVYACVYAQTLPYRLCLRTL